jgi:hypothetical protein
METSPACAACGHAHDAMSPCTYGSAVKRPTRLTHLQLTADDAENRAIEIFRRRRRRLWGR